MSHVHFIAWGSIDVENLGRIPRRTLLRRVRKTFATFNLELLSGGQPPNHPHYTLFRRLEGRADNTDAEVLYDGPSFRNLCAEALKIVDPNSTKPL